MHTLNIYLNKNNNFIENEMNIGIVDISPVCKMAIVPSLNNSTGDTTIYDIHRVCKLCLKISVIYYCILCLYYYGWKLNNTYNKINV